MEDALPYIRNNIQHFKVREPTVLAGSIFRACASIILLVVHMYARRKADSGRRSIQEKTTYQPS